ncbi:putative ribonuclease H-like domain-containing protein [Tanacetum coccineum]
MDVKSAFLYGTIEEEVYVCQPLGFEDPQFPDKVYKVEKALYGLHQAPRAWYETLSTYLIENGFRRGTIDKTLFIKKDKGDILLVHVYVDDIIFGSTKKSLYDEFEDGIFISQDKYVADILKKFDFATVKTTSTPMEPNKALIKDEEADSVDVHLYRSMIGSLMYLTASRPDIMFAVYACVRFQVTPKISHFHVVKRIFRYLKASLNKKSTIRGCQFLGKRLISWQCKKKTIVANSTTKAEYVVAANCCGQISLSNARLSLYCWMKLCIKVDAARLRHMTGNKDQLEDFEEFNEGSVTFGELGHFNLFSISQIYDKQHKVLFTETECLVVSSDFKMPDENQILLKVPRHHNMYSFDMKTPSPAKDEEVELIVVPSAVKIPEEKDESRTSSINSKKEETLTEPQKEKKDSSTDSLEDNPKIQAFRRELEEIALKHLGTVPETTLPVLLRYILVVKRVILVGFRPTPTLRIHRIPKKVQLLGDPKSVVQTRSKVQNKSGAHALLSHIQKQQRNNHKDQQHCLFACFLSQEEPKKIAEALQDDSWVQAMQEELLQFKLQQVWVLVDLPHGMKVIGTKWVYRNKRVKEQIFGLIFSRVVVRNKQDWGPRVYSRRSIDMMSCKSHHGDQVAFDKDGGSFGVDANSKEIFHLYVVKRISSISRANQTWAYGILGESPFDLEAFSDSDYGGSNLDRKSTTGGCQFLGQRLISWQCKKQTIMATSTTEAEYVAAANCCETSIVGSKSIAGLWFLFMNTKIHIDNESTICIVKNPVYHSKTKHIEIRHHFIRDCYEKKLISVEKIHTDLNVADLHSMDVQMKGRSNKYCDKHNQVGFLRKPDESAGFAEIVDFLRGSNLRYALTTNPTIYDSLVKQFWQTATANTNADGTLEIKATLDTIRYTISEASIRDSLQLEDATGCCQMMTFLREWGK